MDKQLLMEDSICCNCGAIARYGCATCGKPLCGRCGTRDKKEILDNVIVHAGLCKSCTIERLNDFIEGSINMLSEAIDKYAK